MFEGHKTIVSLHTQRHPDIHTVLLDGQECISWDRLTTRAPPVLVPGPEARSRVSLRHFALCSSHIHVKKE